MYDKLQGSSNMNFSGKKGILFGAIAIAVLLLSCSSLLAEAQNHDMGPYGGGVGGDVDAVGNLELLGPYIFIILSAVAFTAALTLKWQSKKKK